MPYAAPLPLLPYDPESLTEQLLSGGQRILLYGETGIGKSTLAAAFARIFASKSLAGFCICADPGSPGFGLPGTVSLGRWQNDSWQVLAYEALCSLDAGRFRLPLLNTVKRLMAKVPPGLLLIDAPGVTRGVAGAELLTGMIELLDINTVLVLSRRSKRLPLMDELLSAGIPILAVHAHPEARRPGQKERAHKRTRQWQAYLADTREITVNIADLRLLGAPPPVDVADAWPGRQCAFIDSGRSVSLGEIIMLQNRQLHIRLPATAASTPTLLVRDARSDNKGLLVSAVPFASGNLQFLPPPDALPYPVKHYDGGPRPAIRLRGMHATLLNGVFGDPLLHLRLHQQQRSLLFDLGDSGRLPTRIAHQVSDVFISHAHIDHIGGFLWLLRSRLGEFPSCRLFGPPGLTGHIKGMVDGVLWDRVGDAGPRFEIAEIHGNRLLRTRLQAGQRNSVDLPEMQISDGLIVDEVLFLMRTVTLDHGTPVQAYAFESKPSGEKLVYATDLGDTAANRSGLIDLAHKAEFLFCEAAFLAGDSDQARRTGHLTASACGEIATAADVKQLIPFHFSRRYETRPEDVYKEVGAVCSRVVMPAIHSRDD